MDPRFFHVLSDSSVALAERRLLKVWHSLEQLDGDGNTGERSDNTPQEDINGEDDDDDDDDELEGLLRQADANRTVSSGGQTKKNILPLLKQFCTSQRIPVKTNILQYWESRKFSMPELYAVAMVALAAPATQVSVERLFSGVRFILSDLRLNLEGSLVNNLMVIRTNSLFQMASLKRSAAANPLNSPPPTISSPSSQSTPSESTPSQASPNQASGSKRLALSTLPTSSRLQTPASSSRRPTFAKPRHSTYNKENNDPYEYTEDIDGDLSGIDLLNTSYEN
ncbi:hypothetical protein ONE63_008121 [Megalurothrips usitatus]|uniref:HAT C-terminal dimerisation domain-containing protein n=1 Tax=Megalurothrips usitatus TaxID=439358 RepID=A0AAV7XNI6_9NEOP|nr:hypothetical protein ONE63_008121 [Megalurothrips usitatus]